MKKFIKSLICLTVTVFLVFNFLPVMADPPEPPAGHGESGNQVPAPVGAPIDGELGILIILAISAGYGGIKLYCAKKNEKKEWI